MNGYKYSGKGVDKEHRVEKKKKKKTCDPIVRGIEENLICYWKVWLPMESTELSISFHSVPSSSAVEESFPKFNYIVRKVAVCINYSYEFIWIIDTW